MSFNCGFLFATHMIWYKGWEWDLWRLEVQYFAYTRTRILFPIFLNKRENTTQMDHAKNSTMHDDYFVRNLPWGQSEDYFTPWNFGWEWDTLTVPYPFQAQSTITRMRNTSQVTTTTHISKSQPYPHSTNTQLIRYVCWNRFEIFLTINIPAPGAGLGRTELEKMVWKIALVCGLQVMLVS
jgi:hypothetical protein